MFSNHILSLTIWLPILAGLLVLATGSDERVFGVACYENGIGQLFPVSSVRRPTVRQGAVPLRQFYNTVRPNCSLNGGTPFEVLQAYFS